MYHNCFNPVIPREGGESHCVPEIFLGWKPNTYHKRFPAFAGNDKFKVVLPVLLLAFLILSCGLVDPEIDDSMLDGDVVFDPAYGDSTYFLISDSIPAPTDSQKQMPVIITAHGFSATTYEWQEFRDFADSCGDVLVSQVLLGGHGRTYEVFKASTWEKWQKPVMQEYRALVEAGFENISLAGSSTGGALLLELLGSGAFKGLPAPERIFLVDAIVIPSSKLLTLIKIVGPILGNKINETTEEEKEHWYGNYPAETLSELMEVITVVRKQLERGITLPYGTQMTVYKAREDNMADPVSALLIYKGVRESDGQRADIRIVDSRRHVFTRGRGRSSWTEKDRELQYNTFQEMRALVSSEL
jgi:carboxylesterase